MHDISKRLLYYKRKEIQQAIVDSAKDREVGIRYGDKGFGSRPDVLVYSNDVISSVKKGASSFHVSEERWQNPMSLSTSMKKKELDDLRIGWDLVLDIDCPYWKYSKLSAFLFIRALKQHGLDAISCKFSGNKGFHIGVPFEAFPDKVNNQQVKDLFPEGPKRIAQYLLDYIANNLIEIKKTGQIIFADKYKTTISKISEETGKSEEDLSIKLCPECKTEEKRKRTLKQEIICPNCKTRIEKSDGKSHIICPNCKKIIKVDAPREESCTCGFKGDFKQVFDPLSIVDVDTLLISSRHMYRAPYSMHEKSDLVSLPISPDSVMEFEKEFADPKKVKLQQSFLDRKVKKNEARTLIVQAFDFQPEEKKEHEKKKKYELPETAIPREYFPPSINKGLEGLEDGRKRFLFILINFLTTLGWTHPKIEELVWEWNENNPEPLKENYIRGQLRYAKTNKKVVPPPNYSTGIYKDLQIEDPPNITSKYKNPVTYAKVLYERKNKKKGRRKLTKEQREMRKKYREKIKKQKASKNKDENS